MKSGTGILPAKASPDRFLRLTYLSLADHLERVQSELSWIALGGHNLIDHADGESSLIALGQQIADQSDTLWAVVEKMTGRLLHPALSPTAKVRLNWPRITRAPGPPQH